MLTELELGTGASAVVRAGAKRANGSTMTELSIYQQHGEEFGRCLAPIIFEGLQDNNKSAS